MDLNLEKEQLLVEYLLSSPDTYARCASIVKPDYFQRDLRNAVRFIQEYYDKYNALPDPSQIKAETNNTFSLQQITRDKIDYCANEIEAFCRYGAIKAAVLSAPALMEEQKYGEVEQMIRDAVTVSLNRDIGVNYFEDIRERLERMEKTEDRISTGWKEVDEVLDGGIERKGLIIFSANSGIGKSVVLANLALNLVEQGYNALYISLELSEDLIVQRYDTMISEVPTVERKYKREKIAQAVERKAESVGKLMIKRMNSGTKSLDIRAYLKEFELKQKFIPDVLIVDYLDIMGSNEKVSADNVFEKDKRVSEQLRDIGNDYNMMVASASQQNRGAIDEPRIHQGHVAGGISKVNTADTWISIIANDAMKAAGECRFQFVKTRTSAGVGKSVTLKWLKNIRIVDSDTPTLTLVTNKEQPLQQSKYNKFANNYGENNAELEIDNAFDIDD